MSGCKTCLKSILESKSTVKNENIVKEGRDNENVKLTKNKYIKALNTGQKWLSKNLTYYFVKTSDTTTADDGYNESITNWSTTQKNNYKTGIDSWESVSELTFTEESDGYLTADIKLYLINDVGYSYLGHAYFPGSSYKGQNYTSLNNATDTDFTVGSYDYITMIHEFGHTLGLAHPHDKGGNSTKFPGVSGSSSLGTNNQNQTIYTIMSYNDLNGPLTPDTIQSYGFVYGPSAYDIATIQHIYGSSVSKSVGDTTYTLPSSNEEGTYNITILDTSGTDTIDAGDLSKSVNIDLRDASLKGNGGYISKANNISGGFTIANKTVIENAIGGSGNDVIRGNRSNNILTGNDGNDIFYASNGVDVINGGSGIDTVVFPGRRKHYKIIKLSSTSWRFVAKKRFKKIRKKVRKTTLNNINKIKFNNKTFNISNLKVNKDRSN